MAGDAATGPRVEVIAEVANAHQGNPDIAVDLALACLDAGADVVKFQIYFAEELLTESHPRFAHFRRQAFAPEVWETVLAKAKGRGRVYCDVFGLKALEVAMAAGVDGFKIHSSDLAHEPLLIAVARTGRQALLSAGGSTAREIARALSLAANPAAPRPIVMHGFQSYPTAVEDTGLVRLGWLGRLFGERCTIGYMDHVDAEDSFAVTLPILAIGQGARVIEKHVTFDRAARGIDYYSSLEPAEFASFMTTVRRAEAAMGTDPEAFAPSERTYRRQMKKYWVTRRALCAGEILGLDDVTMKRAPEAEAEVPDLEQLLGRPLVADRSAEHVLRRDDVPARVWALVVARMRSSRLPGKALLDVAGQPALAHLFARLQQARTPERVVLCTTRDSADDPLARLGEHCGVQVFRGDTDNVLARMLGAIEGAGVDVVLRVTGDDILCDPGYLDRAVRHHLAVNAEYTDMKPLPSGMEVEVFDLALLQRLAALARDGGVGTEYLTWYVTHHSDQFRTASGPVDEPHRQPWRLTLDTPEDFEVIRRLLAAMKAEGKAVTYTVDDVVRYLTAHPEVLELNAGVRQRQSVPSVVTDLQWERLL